MLWCHLRVVHTERIIAKLALIDKCPAVWYIYSMTYAIIESGNKQYKVEKGSIIDVELLGVEAGSKPDIDKVLLVSGDGKVSIGTPYIKNAAVKCSVVDAEIKDKKVVIFKYKSKSNYHKKTGHRQRYSRLLVEDISVK